MKKRKHWQGRRGEEASTKADASIVFLMLMIIMVMVFSPGVFLAFWDLKKWGEKEKKVYG